MTADEDKQIADLIERFVDGSIGPWEWDDFISFREPTPKWEMLQREIASVAESYSQRIEQTGVRRRAWSVCWRLRVVYAGLKEPRASGAN
jgi:hypothetical protein